MSAGRTLRKGGDGVLAGDLHTSATVGTFALAGAHFLGAGATGPNILEATQVFTGTDGAITVALEGRFGPLPARTAAGAGQWHIVTGTGSYTHEHDGGIGTRSRTSAAPRRT